MFNSRNKMRVQANLHTISKVHDDYLILMKINCQEKLNIIYKKNAQNKFFLVLREC
jgi:hypothetical protein